jgi:hypothetical protein
MAEWYEDYNNWLKLLPIVGGIGGTVIGNNAINNAAGTSAEAARAAAARLDPYANAGAQAVTDYGNLLRQGPGDYSSYMNTPYYKFPLEQGLKAQQGTAAAKGGLLSGAAVKGATRYAEDYASKNYQNWMDNWYKSLSAYNPLITTGYGAAGQQAGYDALAGMSKAAGQISQGQNWADLINAIGKWGGDLGTLNQLKKILEGYQTGTGTIPPTGTYPPNNTTPYNPGSNPQPPVLADDVITPVTEAGTTAGGLYGADAIYGIGGAPTATAGADAFSGLYGMDAVYGIGGGAPAGAEAFSGLYGADAIYGIGGAPVAGAETGALAAGAATALTYAWAAAPVVLSIWAYGKGKAEQWKGLNPFATEDGPAVLASITTLNNGVADVNQIDFYKSRLPSVDTFKARYQAETGNPAPTATTMHRDQADPFISWMDRQPEIQAARQEYLQWFQDNYRWNDMGGAGGEGFWEKVDRHERPYVDNVTYGAQGAIIDEPMVAVGMNTGKKLVMGEAGPEALVPMRGKFNPEAEFIRSKKKYRMKPDGTLGWV